MRTLRDDVIPRRSQGSDVAVHVGGVTAAGIDVSDRLSSRLPFFIGAVLVLSFLLLLGGVPQRPRAAQGRDHEPAVDRRRVRRRRGRVPVGLVRRASSASSKAGPIAPFIPMMMFAIVFGLSMDYEVFLLSRIREEYDRTGDNALAVADGLAATARVITAAALIMVTVFASFVTGAEPTLKLFGLGLAVAIFIDATLVRMVLVPATMELLGDRNWWFPKWLDRIVPRLHVESIDDVDAELAAMEARPSRASTLRTLPCCAVRRRGSQCVDEPRAQRQLALSFRLGATGVRRRGRVITFNRPEKLDASRLTRCGVGSRILWLRIRRGS